LIIPEDFAIFQFRPYGVKVMFSGMGRQQGVGGGWNEPLQGGNHTICVILVIISSRFLLRNFIKKEKNKK